MEMGVKVVEVTDEQEKPKEKEEVIEKEIKKEGNKPKVFIPSVAALVIAVICAIEGSTVWTIIASTVSITGAIVWAADFITRAVRNSQADGTALVAKELKNQIGILERVAETKAEDKSEGLIFVDTSVLFDSRMIDLLTDPLFQGRFCIPRFVLEELVTLSKNGNKTKSELAKDVLGGLEAIKENNNLVIVNQAREVNKEVDIQLIDLAQKMGAVIFSNDTNLLKKANMRGVKTSSLIELCESLEEPYGIGELFEIDITRKGKQKNEGLGYIRDGSTVVVDNGLAYMGQKVLVKIDSVLKTPSGRLLFANVENGNE